MAAVMICVGEHGSPLSQSQPVHFCVLPCVHPNVSLLLTGLVSFAFALVCFGLCFLSVCLSNPAVRGVSISQSAAAKRPDSNRAAAAHLTPGTAGKEERGEGKGRGEGMEQMTWVALSHSLTARHHCDRTQTAQPFARPPSVSSTLALFLHSPPPWSISPHTAHSSHLSAVGRDVGG